MQAGLHIQGVLNKLSVYLCRRFEQRNDTVFSNVCQPATLGGMRRVHRQARHNNCSAQHKVDCVKLTFHVVLPFKKRLRSRGNNH